MKSKNRRQWKLLDLKRPFLTLSVLLVVVIMLAIGFAWFLFGGNHTDTDELNIMAPYTLYLLNSGGTDALELNVGGIHPGETKQIVVCVSSHDAGQPQTSKNGSFPYKLELVYTENIGLQYSLYEVEPTTQALIEGEEIITSYYEAEEEGTTVQKAAYFIKGDQIPADSSDTSMNVSEMYGSDSSVQNQIVNKGKYDVFTGENFQLSLHDPQQRYKYYLIEIGWADETKEASAKETDLVYLIAKAGVPKPEEIK